MLLPQTIIYYSFLTIVTLIGICMNVFFAFCMLWDEQKSLKPPLLALLATGVSHNMLLQISLLMYTFNPMVSVVLAFLIYSGLSCMSSNVWLSIFFYTKIVSSQNTVFVWIRRNIATVVYAGLIVDKIYLVLFVSTIEAPRFLASTPANDSSSPANATVGLEDDSVWYSIQFVFTRFHLAYLLTFIGLMTWVWTCTLIYICRHIRSMEGTSSPLSNPKLLSQIRVVVQGIVQTVLYVITAGAQVITLFPKYVVLDPKSRGYLLNISIAIYTLGTAINLGLSQHLFRERAVRVVARLKSGDCWRCRKIV